MNYVFVQLLAMAVTLSGPVLGTAFAQQHDHAAPAAKPAGKPAAPAASAQPQQEVFCATMKTGLLCTHGTASALGLPPDKAAVWLEAVNKYNKAVNEATVILQREAKGTLSAAQMAEVDRWFAIGVNQQINQLLAAPAKAKAAQ